jgi:hypothetical protein
MVPVTPPGWACVQSTTQPGAGQSKNSSVNTTVLLCPNGIGVAEDTIGARSVNPRAKPEVRHYLVWLVVKDEGAQRIYESVGVA